MKNLTITVKTLFGLEEALKDELFELDYKNVEVLNRAVQLKGNWEDVYRLNFRCRLAISVLVQIKSFRIHKEEDLYKKAKEIDWTSYFDVDKTFAVKGAVFSTMFSHSQYPLLVVKDAIADVFRDKFDRRPDVNIKSPQVMFDVYIKDKSVIVSLNTSGVPLFQRGYRQEVGEAPMNEVLAAGILRLSGWDRKSTLIDPMTGSGTIAIEAALWAADIPAMIERSHFAFKNFKSFLPEVWDKVRQEGNQRPIDLGFDILAYDIDGEMIQKAKRNSSVAPIGNMVTFERKDATTIIAPDKKGTLICNPPYEERMGEDVEELYQQLGDTFKHNMHGYDCWVISSNMDAFKSIALRPDKKIRVFNGNLECSLRLYTIFEGAKKDQYKDSNTADSLAAGDADAIGTSFQTQGEEVELTQTQLDAAKKASRKKILKELKEAKELEKTKELEGPTDHKEEDEKETTPLPTSKAKENKYAIPTEETTRVVEEKETQEKVEEEDEEKESTPLPTPKVRESKYAIPREETKEVEKESTPYPLPKVSGNKYAIPNEGTTRVEKEDTEEEEVEKEEEEEIKPKKKQDKKDRPDPSTKYNF